MPFSFTAEQKQTLTWLLLGLLLLMPAILLGPVLTTFVAPAILVCALRLGVDWLASKRIGKLRSSRMLATIASLFLRLCSVLPESCSRYPHLLCGRSHSGIFK